MRTASLAPSAAYRAAFSAERRSDVALLVVLITLFGVTLALYDAYAKGLWGGPDRTLAIPQELDPVPVVLSDFSQPKASQPATASLQAAVQRANIAWADARARAEIWPLQSVATGEWLAQEQAYIDGLRARGQTERWRLLGLEFVQVELRPDGSGFVCTNERWEAQVLRADGSVVSTSSYSFTEGYTLVPGGFDWLVTRVETAQQ
jgi:hypothetical protein